VNPGVQIDRISLRVPGVDRDAGARLAQLVAEQLVPSLQLGPGEAVIDRLTMKVAAQPGESLESLSARIAAQIGETLEAAR
jgi:hypothetical protein